MDRTRSVESPGPTAVAAPPQMVRPPTSSRRVTRRTTPRMSTDLGFFGTAAVATTTRETRRELESHAVAVPLTTTPMVTTTRPPRATSVARARARTPHMSTGDRATRTPRMSTSGPFFGVARTTRETRRAELESSAVAASHATAAATSVDAPATPARRSTRKRKPPDLLMDEQRPRKRKAESSSSPKKPTPEQPPAKKRALGRLKTDPDDEDEKEAATDSSNNCCICMTEPEPDELAAINGCEHHFCFGCIEKWADRENTCPLCKKRFTKIDRVHKPKRQKGAQTTPKSSVKVSNKSQRTELAHFALEGLFDNLGRNGISIESIFARLATGGGGGSQNFAARVVFSGIRESGTGPERGGAPVPPRSASASTSAARGSDSSSSTDAAAAAAASGSSSGSRSRRMWARASPEIAAQLEAAGVPSISVRPSFFAGFSPNDGEDSDGDDQDNSTGVRVGDDFQGFIEAVRDRRGFSFSSSSFPSVGMMHVPQPTPPARSFASNGNDLTAGASAENALEIEDSDDDDEVEILETRSSSNGRSRSSVPASRSNGGSSSFAPRPGSYRGM